MEKISGFTVFVFVLSAFALFVGGLALGSLYERVSTPNYAQEFSSTMSGIFWVFIGILVLMGIYKLGESVGRDR